MNTFKSYLIQNRKQLETVRTYTNEAIAFEKWAKAEAILKPEKATYNELLSFVQYCRAKGNSAHTIGMKVAILKHYFTFHKHPQNPALELGLRTVQKVTSSCFKQHRIR